MAQINDREKSIATLAERIKGIGVAMLTTLEPDGSLLSRPMITQKTRFDGNLWFLSRSQNRLVWEIQRHPRVGLTYSEPGSGLFVAVTGTASIVRDRQKAAELWDPSYNDWFPDGVDDPELVLLRVTVETAQTWGAPSVGNERLEGFLDRA